MQLGSSCGLLLAACLSVGPVTGAAAQVAPPSGSKASPSVDTGAAGTEKFPVREQSEPGATGAVGSPAVNPPGNPPGTIKPSPDAAVRSGASGNSPCFPGQSGQRAGNTNPSGAPSRC
ncbi:hypothetical protein [Microvirga subterranea]|uniref:Translation initiation factor IF-2 n=1 Tax=Microvirga subterranea TaxID=186651 RepID=A0A370HJ85_9HYPH|nr:hypothetical protein [Microvirga subterranea]RDI57820.1 hypothetical protein DES45_106134 [Microvirga subterranea]